MTPSKCAICPVRPGLTCRGEGRSPLCLEVAGDLPGLAESLVSEAEYDALPGLLEKAGNLARAVVSHVADGGRIASPEVQAERKELCFSCSHLDKTRDACSACGCGVICALSFVGMDMDKKRSWASSRCPLSQPRWEAV